MPQVHEAQRPGAQVLRVPGATAPGAPAPDAFAAAEGSAPARAEPAQRSYDRGMAAARAGAPADAVRLLRAAADDGYAPAAVAYSDLLSTTTTTTAAAPPVGAPAANAADPVVAFRLLTHAVHDHTAALDVQGAAWTRLGKLYSKGRGCRRSHADAVQCYTRAARLGNPTGRGLLAMSHITGTGTPRDLHAGWPMLVSVAEQGDVTAMRNIAWLYKNGRDYGVQPDPDCAAHWSKVASVASRAASLNHVQRLPKKTTWLPGAADHGGTPTLRGGGGETATLATASARSVRATAPPVRTAAPPIRTAAPPSTSMSQSEASRRPGGAGGAIPKGEAPPATNLGTYTMPSVASLYQAPPSPPPLPPPPPPPPPPPFPSLKRSPVHQATRNVASSYKNSHTDDGSKPLSASAPVGNNPQQASNPEGLSVRLRNSATRHAVIDARPVTSVATPNMLAGVSVADGALGVQRARLSEEVSPSRRLRDDTTSLEQSEPLSATIADGMRGHEAVPSRDRRQSELTMQSVDEMLTEQGVKALGTRDAMVSSLDANAKAKAEAEEAIRRRRIVHEQKVTAPPRSLPLKPAYVFPERQLESLADQRALQESHVGQTMRQTEHQQSSERIRPHFSSPESTAKYAQIQEGSTKEQECSGPPALEPRPLPADSIPRGLVNAGSSKRNVRSGFSSSNDIRSPKLNRTFTEEEANVGDYPSKLHAADSERTRTLPKDNSQSRKQLELPPSRSTLHRTGNDGDMSVAATRTSIDASDSEFRPSGEMAERDAAGSEQQLLRVAEAGTVVSGDSGGNGNEGVSVEHSSEFKDRLRRFGSDDNTPRKTEHSGPHPRVTSSNSEYMDMAKNLRLTYPRDLFHPEAHREVFLYLDKMQDLAWNSHEAGRYLIDEGGVDTVCHSMLTYPSDSGIQERAIHALIRLIRAADENQREGLILAHSTREVTPSCTNSVSAGLSGRQVSPPILRPDSAYSRGSGGSGGSGGSRHSQSGLNPVHAVITAMRSHPEVMTIQMAGCNALAEFMSVSHVVRWLVLEGRGQIAMVDALRVSGRANSFDRLYLVHEMGCRALCEFCRGSDTDTFKEAVGDVNGVEQVVITVGRWSGIHEAPSDKLSNVTRHACATVRYLTHHCEANAWRALNAKALPILVTVLQTHAEQANVCLSAVSAMISIAIVNNETALRDLDDSDALGCLLAVVRRHSDHALLVRKSMQCLRLLLTFGNSMRRPAIELEAVEISLEALRMFPDDPRLQEQACGAIGALTRDEKDAKDKVALLGGVELITRSIVRHKKDALLIEQALGALSTICAHHAGNLELAMKLDTATPVLSALKSYCIKEPGVIIAGSTVVRVFALSHDSTLCDKLLILSAPEVLLKAMKTHPDVPRLQEHASIALGAMCTKNASLPKRIARAGAVDLLVAMLKTHIAHANVVYGIVCAIRAMVAKSREVVLQFIVERLPLVLHGALSHHMRSLPQTDKVVMAICAVLNYCGFKTVAHKNEIGAAGLIEQLRDLVAISSEKEDLAVLQPTLATLCTLLISCPDNQDRFQEVGGVEAVLETLERWRGRENIVAVSCDVLRHACNDHDNNRDDFKAVNGIRKLQSTLQTYQENPNVVRAVCLALADICHNDPELQTSAGMLDTIPRTVTAMQTFASNGSLQAGACSFLFAITKSNPRNKARVVRHGGRAAIICALKRHPENDEVSSFGGHALLQVQDVPAVEATSVEGSTVESDIESDGVEPRRRIRLLPGRRKTSRDHRLQYSNLSPDAVSPGSPMDNPSVMPVEPLTAPASPQDARRRRVRRRRPREETEAPEMHQLHGGSFHQPDRGEALPLGESHPDIQSRRPANGGWFRRRSQQSRGSDGSSGLQSADSERRSFGSGFSGFGLRRRSLSSRNDVSAETGEDGPAQADRFTRGRVWNARNRGRAEAIAVNDGDDGHVHAIGNQDNDIGNLNDLDGLSDGFDPDDRNLRELECRDTRSPNFTGQ